jgi:hypothetical protein
MNRKLFWIFSILLAWFGRDGARAQQRQPVTSIQPDCVIFFRLTVASSGAQATPFLPGQTSPPAGSAGTSLVCDDHQVGAYGWTVAYTSFGFTALSLSFQSAPDNGTGTAPGTWSTVAVCGGTECLGINPNTSTTSAITTTKVIAPWLRVNLTSKTGTGAVVGVLYGYKVNIVQNGGAPVIAFPANVFLATNGASVPIASNAATAPLAVPIGRSSAAAGTNAIAIGASASASGTEAIAIGSGALSSATGSICIGSNFACGATATNAIGIGSAAAASSANSIAIGPGSTASASAGFAIGNQAVASASNAVAIGASVTNSVANSVNIGTNSVIMLKLLANGAEVPTVAFAGLGALNNSSLVGCSNCTVTSGIDNTCAGAGTGAIAQRINGAWKCTI